jgi:hypothetical protein
LQRRSGYRELLRAWLRFHLTAQLSWNFDKDEDNIFAGGKKDIASLYEYWVFFVLFNTLTNKYGQLSTKNPNSWIEGLIVPDRFGLGLTLQEGKTRAFEFKYQDAKRPLNIKFYYNRPFVGGRIYENNKGAGSYSKSFRPDYTLSIWPDKISQNIAEETESIVHIHFDAKYKVEYSFVKEQQLEMVDSVENSDEELVQEIEGIINNSKNDAQEIEKRQIINEKIKELGYNDYNDLKGEKLDELLIFYKSIKEELIATNVVTKREKEEKEGSYKNIDLYKMHAYKDAIRRSGGAYILYPGKTESKTNFQGFHEIIPGVGAFALRPNNEKDASENIGNFIDQVIQNLEDVLSQRERMARSAEKVYADKPAKVTSDSKLDSLIRQLGTVEIIDETYVLVGYCKDEKHKKWISGDKKKMRYNIRFGDGYEVDGKMAAARYLILYSGKDFLHHEIYKIKPDSAKIYSKDDLKKNDYQDAHHSLYFVYELDEKIELDFTYKFDKDSSILTEKLSELKSNYRPFTLSLMELANIRLKFP